MSAARRWREQLEAWAIPEDLLEEAEGSPYEWPPELWKRRRAAARQERVFDTPTFRILGRLTPPGGTVLDVGAGTGRLSLVLAEEGYRVTAVERDPGMAKGFREETAATGVEADLVEGPWPEAAGELEAHHTVLCAHVVYDVQDIAPFLEAMEARATRGVVLEMTPAHPWAHLAPYYRALHDLDRPDGPTADDLAAVVEETIGVAPHIERWARGGGLWFVDRDELVELIGRRLVVPRSRREELEAVLEPDIAERDGRLYLGSGERELVTLWWEASR